ncbi:Zinc finger C2H2-type [Fusarium oxysporum f. sp. vasinfectum]|nr:Zinc finger C2H2-type [Fusarium oxysporum f. sp. vasinfectum]
MASPQRLSLERSLGQFRRELTHDQNAEISGANRKAIEHVIQEIQAKLGRKQELCRLTRIEKFLDAMEQIEKLVTIFLNASDFVAFVWGPIKLALMAATTWKDCVRELVDVYEEIADALGNLVFFKKLIQSREHLRLILEDYFSDILRFHRCILKVFSRPDWKGFFKWAWGSFRDQIKPIIESLKRKQEMLSDDKLQLHAILKEVQDSDEYAKDQFRQLQAGLEDIKATLNSSQLKNGASQHQEIKLFLEKKLDVSLSQTRSQLELPDTDIGSSGSWIFSHPLFHQWDTNASPQNNVLFLSGCPGAGKSTLARTIIRQLSQKRAHQSMPLSCLTYFFFKHDDVDRKTTQSMLRHIIVQSLNADETVMRFIYDKCSSLDSLNLPVLKDLALECLVSQRNAVVILDGLDEATDNEPEKALRWCLDELLPTASLRGSQVKLLVCGQEDGRVEPLLSSYQHYQQIRLHTVDFHQQDIEGYAKTQASIIGARFRLSPDGQRDLITKVTEASQGMFLYAKVVLTNLASMCSVKEFKNELRSDKFPLDLDQAYERIVQRVLRDADPPSRESVRRILGWVVCSARPLRWREIQSRFCIDAEKEICDPDDLRVDSCKKLCSSLVDAADCELFSGVESEQTITMIHETASKYLVHTGTINLLQEHVDMALFCCRYLSSRPFLRAKSDNIRHIIPSGYFGLMDYATVHYLTHTQKAESLGDRPDSSLKIQGVKAAVADLIKAYCSKVPDQAAVSDEVEDTPCEKGKDSNLVIQDTVLAIRIAMDRLPDSISEGSVFRELHGPTRFKCPKIHCSKFSVGFSYQPALDAHINVHERPFRCNHDDCFAYVVGFTSREELQDHTDDIHTDESQASVKFPAGNGAKKRDLYDACKSGDLDEVKRLHLAGARLTRIAPQQPTYLMVAYAAGHKHVCKYLVDNGANPYQYLRRKPFYRSAPIDSALATKDLAMLSLFLKSNQDLNDEKTIDQFSSCIAKAILNDFRPGLELLMAGRQPTDRARMTTRVFLELSWANRRRHSNDTALMHLWLQQTLPNLYDNKGLLSPPVLGVKIMRFVKRL